MNSTVDTQFVDFVRAVSPRLLTSAWMLCGDPHVAEELVQEALARVYAHWRKAQVNHPLAYTRRVLLTVHTDRWRKRRREVLTDEVLETEAPEGLGEHVDLVRALRALPPRERECVVLRHYLDLSEKEAADTLGVSVGTVKSSTSRGLSALRAALTEGEPTHV